MRITVDLRFAAIVLAALNLAGAKPIMPREVLSTPTGAELDRAYGDSQRGTPPEGLEFFCFVSPDSRPNLTCVTPADPDWNDDESSLATLIFARGTELAPPAHPGEWRRLTGRIHRDQLRGGKKFRVWVDVVSIEPSKPFRWGLGPMIRPRPPFLPGSPIHWKPRAGGAVQKGITRFGACLWTELGTDVQRRAKQELLRSGDRFPLLIFLGMETDPGWKAAWERCDGVSWWSIEKDRIAPYFRYRAASSLLFERGVTEAELKAAVRGLPPASLAATGLDVRIPEESPWRGKLWAPVFAALGLEQPATWKHGSTQALVVAHFQALAEMQHWIDDDSPVSDLGRDLRRQLRDFDGPEISPQWVRQPTGEELAAYYPRLALAAGESPVATVACVVDTDGTPVACRQVSTEIDRDPEGFVERDSPVELAQCCYRLPPQPLGDPHSPTEGRPVVRFKITWPFDLTAP